MYKFLLVPSGIFAADDDAAARKRKEIAAKLRGGTVIDNGIQVPLGHRDGVLEDARQSAAVTRPAAPASSSPAQSSSQKQVSVLIVEKTALMRNLIERIIEETPGFVIADKTISIEFARQKIPRCNPDVILFDIDIDDYYSFFDECQNKKIPVVALAANGEEDKVKKALLLGARSYAYKPKSSLPEDVNGAKGKMIERILSVVK